jgi:tetratricopeptide (TPR) repeat protein
LRPFAVEGVQEPRLTVVNNPDFFKSESRIGGKFQNAQLANLDQLPLPNDLALLAETSLAFVFHKRRYYGKAAEILGDVLKSPNLPDAAPGRWALNLFRGNDFYFSGNTTKAIADYREAIRLKPDLADARLNLGAALDDEGQYDAAIAEDREAIRLKPDYEKAHSNLGAALAGKGQYDAAIAEYREAIRLKPDYAEAHNNLGASLAEKGQYDAAIVEYREAIRLIPDYAEAHNNLDMALKRVR